MNNVTMNIYMQVLCNYIFSFFLKKTNYSNQKKYTEGVIKQPFWYFYVGVFGIIGFNLIGLIFLLHQKEIISWIVMLSISLPYIIIIVYSRNWKIEFDDVSFSFTNIWKIKKKYLYNQVEIINNGRALKVYFEKKKVLSVSTLVFNVDLFEKSYNKFIKKNKVLYNDMLIVK